MRHTSYGRSELFGRRDLRETLHGKLVGMQKDVLGWDPDELLRSPEHDIVDHLVDKHSVLCPQLNRDGIHQLPVGETTGTFEDIAGRTFQRQLTVMTIAVPYQGDQRVFLLRPARCSMREWHTEVTETELGIRWTGQSGDHAAARRHFDEELDEIEKHLGWARELIDPHNAGLDEHARRLVRQRREKLLSDRGMEAALGFPVRHRQGPQPYAAPLNRRKITPRPQPAAAGPFQPEMELAEADYEEALRIISNLRSSLERSPSTTAKMGEEDIRNQILVALNGQFDGQAAGEVFNGHGKTDILIRVEDRNIFIAECKNWKGPKAVTDALDEQLLGRYLVWRDTKAAFLLFIRDGNPTEIIRKAAAQIGQHPHCKRVLPPQENDRHDFVFSSVHDPDRQIHLAFIPFVLLSEPKP